MKEITYPKKKNSKLMEIAVIIIAFAVIIVACVGAYFMLGSGSGEKKIEEYLNIADQLVQSQNYKEAISNYWHAIEVDKYNEKPYIGLGSVYETINDYDTAISVYRMGYERTGSSSLSGLIDNMELLIKNNSADKKHLDKTQPVVNKFSLGKLSVYTYERYCNNYGTPEIDMTDENSCTVSFKGLGAILYYYNTSSDQNVINRTGGTPTATKIPNEISLKDLSLLFSGITDKITYDEIAALSVTGLKKYEDTKLKKNVIEFQISGFKAIIECDANNCVSVNSWNRLYPLASSSENKETQSCSVSGRVIDSTTNEGVNEATVQIFRTDDLQLVTEISTDANGDYSFDGIEEGLYTARVKADGFIEEDFEVTAYTWDNATAKNFFISPELAANTIRLVLEWNDEPRDLDSYLQGTSSSGSSVNVCYYNRTQADGDKTIADLDVDCTSGYGPETTTLYDVQGEYEFIVHDFRSTGTLGTMGATVKIYTSTETSPIIVEVPMDVQNTWEVCTIKNGQVEVTNRSGDNRPTRSVSGK